MSLEASTVPDRFVPPELAELRQWVVWRRETVGGRQTKVPYRATQSTVKASSTDSSSWSSLEEAITACAEPGIDGIGFVVTKDCGLTFIDFDHAVADDGMAKPWARTILRQLNSYTELSPSGSGFHVLVKGSIPGPRCRTAHEDGIVELYDNARYFTFVGRPYSGYEMIHGRQAELEELYNQLFKPEPTPEHVAPVLPLPVNLNDRDLLERAMNASNGHRFRALWEGDISAYSSQNEADLALCGMLAFWTGGDTGRIDNLFRQSGLMRAKWDEKRGQRTYAQRTIDKALEGKTEFYDPTSRGGEIRHGKESESGPDAHQEVTVRDQKPSAPDWRRLDLGPILRGDIAPAEPEHLAMADGSSLFYARLVHWLSGEPESLKTWLALLLIASELAAGNRCLMLDFEGDAHGVVGRLLGLGATPERILKCFAYIRPGTPLNNVAQAALAAEAEAIQPVASVIDGVNASMGLCGLDPIRAQDFTSWWSRIGYPIQVRTSGPTVAIDHVGRDAEKRGAYAYGSVAKLAVVDGAHIGVELVDRFGRGLTGKARLMLHKDKPGALRGRLGASNLLATMTLASDPETGAVASYLEPATASPTTGSGDSRVLGIRPTTLMQRVSEYLEGAPESPSLYRILEDVKGKRQFVSRAVQILVEEGFAQATPAGKGNRYSSLQPYREALDEQTGSPERNRFPDGSQGTGSPVPTPYLKGGNREPVMAPVLDQTGSRCSHPTVSTAAGISTCLGCGASWPRSVLLATEDDA